MTRKASTQWEFDDLLEPKPARRVYTVGELTSAVRCVLERDLGLVWVSGELSNFRMQSSGHAYFTLKDATSQLSCVLFRGTPTAYRTMLEDGLHVLLQGELTVYEPRGQYQLVVRQIELHGVGALQVAFETLKKKLQGEGLFAPERKRPIPEFIETLGVVTSPTGAALRDVLHVVARRHPGLRLVLAPCRVQGEGAVAEIVAAIDRLNRWAARPNGKPRLDAILVTRGGGSLEDLWAFNEEPVARAIAASALPVVSAVGHEVDFSISDFVADLRAATPSAAAEVLTEGAVAGRQWLAEVPGMMVRAVRDRLESEKETLGFQVSSMSRSHPRKQLEACAQRVDDAQASLARSVTAAMRVVEAQWTSAYGRWHRLSLRQRIGLERDRGVDWLRRLVAAGSQAMERKQEAWNGAATRLRLLSPQNVLDRGYSITWDLESGAVVRDPAELRPGRTVKTRVHRGAFLSRVLEVDDDEKGSAPARTRSEGGSS